MIIGPLCIAAGIAVAAFLVTSPNPYLGIPGALAFLALVSGGWDILQRSRRLRRLRRDRRPGYVR